MANKQNFTLTMGEDRTLSMTARDSTGAVLNLTGATITFRMGRVGEASLLTKTGSITTAASGTFTVALTDSDADPTLYRARNYTYQVLITISGTTTVGVSGKIRFEGQIASA